MARIPPFAQRILVAISAIESYIRVWMQEDFVKYPLIPWLKNHQKAPGTLLYKASGHILVGEFLYHHRRKPTLIVIRIGRV